ncbi:tetratricopeptide repeat protein [Streptomyces asoensis]|uniref:tetratricopeptide repeat protein n=1 Tax=Streptomyces asoensis TaxID=249586 RepID=UPI0033FFFB91
MLADGPAGDSWKAFREDLRALHEAAGSPTWDTVATWSGVARATAHSYFKDSDKRVGNGSWASVGKVIDGLIRYADRSGTRSAVSEVQRDIRGWDGRWTRLDGPGQAPAVRGAPRGVGMLGGWDGAGLVALSADVSAQFAHWAANHPHLDRLAAIIAQTGELGYPREAADLAGKLVARTVEATDERHPASLAARHAHSYWTGQAGDPRRALEMTDVLRQECEQYLGAGHTLTLLARLRAAAWQQSVGLVAESRRAYAELARMNPAPDQQFVLLARLGRAEGLGMAGEPAEAADQLSPLLPDLDRTFGAHHPVTVRARITHANCTLKAGHQRAAYELLKSLSDSVAGHLDRAHPVTLLLRAYTVFSGWHVEPLSTTLHQARELHEEAGSLLGNDHPLTLTTQNLLGIALYDVDRVQAKTVMTDVHKSLERVLGPENPSTLNAAHNLATAIHTVDGAEAALPHYRTTHDARQRVLGPDHPDTLHTANNVAKAIHTVDGAKAALPHYRTTHDARQRVLGPDHPDTLRTAHNLAAAIHTVDGAKAALPYYRTTHAARQRVLGPDHPDTLRTASNLAAAIHMVDGAEAALDLYRATHAAQERVLGPDHPDTQRTAGNLARAVRWLSQQDPLQ